MKILVLVLVIILTGCNAVQQVSINTQPTSMKEMMNKEIIDGFFDGDTIGISKEYYFFRVR